MCSDDIADSDLHCHCIIIAYANKTIHKPNSDKIDKSGMQYLYLSMLFNSMIDHALHPILFSNHLWFPFQKVQELIYQIKICTESML